VIVFENGLVGQLGVDLDPTPSNEVIDDAERNLRQLTLPVGKIPGALRALAEGTGIELARTLRAVADAWPGLQLPRRSQHGLSRRLPVAEGQGRGVVRVVAGQLEDAPNVHEGIRAGYNVTLDDAGARVSASFSCGSGTGLLTLIGPASMRYRDALAIA